MSAANPFSGWTSVAIGIKLNETLARVRGGLTDDEVLMLDVLTAREKEAAGGLNRKRWQRHDDARLVQLLDQGLCAPAIGVQMQRSPQAVRSRVKRLRRRATGFCESLKG